MTITQLKTVVALIENNFNVSLTAQKLHKVQSAVSNQIHALENEVGSPLFQRKGKRLIGTTELCEKMLPQIKSLLNSSKDLKAIIDEYTDEDNGELRIATTNTQAHYFLPGVIKAFRERYPNVKLTFNLENPSRFPQMLRDRNIDVAVFAEDFFDTSNLIAKKCYQWSRVLILRSDHPLAKGKITLERIAEYPIVTYMSGYADRHLIEEGFARAGLFPDISCSTGDTEVIKTYVGLDLGIGITAQMVSVKNTNKHLMFRNVKHLFGHSVTRIVYSESSLLRNHMRYFVKTVYNYGKIFEKQLHS